MDRIDLIIDALAYARACIGRQLTSKDKLNHNLDKLHEALAAARELKALKPVAWVKSTENGYNFIDYKSKFINQLSNETPLYALDEVKHD